MNMRKSLKSVFIFACFFSNCAISGDAPFPFAPWGWNENKERVIEGSYLTVAGLKIGLTTLNEASSIFGKSPLFKLSDKSYSPQLICYSSPIDDSLVVLQSGPLGAWSVITAIFIGESKSATNLQCPKSNLVNRENLKINNLSLSTSKNDVIDYIGLPTFLNQNLAAYRYKDAITTKEGHVFDVSSGIEIEFDSIGITWFRVYQLISN